MVGILVSFWDGLFSGAMLVSGRVLVRSPFFHKAFAFVVFSQALHAGSTSSELRELAKALLGDGKEFVSGGNLGGWASHL